MGYAYGFDSVPETGYTPHQAAITGLAEWIEKSLHTFASKTTKDNDDEIVNNIVNVLNGKTDSRAKRIVHYRGGSATATISGSSKKVNYTAPKDKNGNPKYKSTKEIFKIDECILLTGEKKEKKEEGKRAPWMEIAWEQEAKKLVETGSNKEIQKFFKGTAYEKTMGTIDQKTKRPINEKTISWCASFVNWVMVKYGYKSITTDGGYDATRALKWAKWPEGNNIGKPVYGAIAVKTRNGGGHVGFVAGRKGDFIVVLGGNQGNKLQCSTYNISDFFAYVIPNDYKITDEDYNLPEYKGNPAAKGSES